AIVAYHKLSKRGIADCLSELVIGGFLEDCGDGVYRDAEFLTVCRSHEERGRLRAEWSEAKRTRRLNSKSQMSLVDSRPESPVDSIRDSFTSLSLSPSESLSPSPPS